MVAVAIAEWLGVTERDGPGLHGHGTTGQRRNPDPDDVRELLEAPNYVHLSTCGQTARPQPRRVGRVEGERLPFCTSDWTWKAKDLRRNPRVGLSVIDLTNPYRMTTLQGRVVEERPDEGCRLMDPISYKYTNAPFPSRGPDRVWFVIAVEKAHGHPRVRPQPI